MHTLKQKYDISETSWNARLWPSSRKFKKVVKGKRLQKSCDMSEKTEIEEEDTNTEEESC
jgi:hypothetical protein